LLNLADAGLVVCKAGEVFEYVEHLVLVFHLVEPLPDVFGPAAVSGGAVALHEEECPEVRPQGLG